MVNFLDSFKQGLLAAEKSIANKQEIDGVINSLSKQLGEATGGNLKIFICEKPKPISGFFDVRSAEQTLLSRQLVIAAVNPQADYGPKPLAEWGVDESGYPCRITMEDTEVYCEDKESLEKALAYLLSTPETGKKLKALIDLKPKF